MKNSRYIVYLLFMLIYINSISAQEILVPIVPSISNSNTKNVDTVTVLLPFVDDFSDYEGVPNRSLWLTKDALVNKDYDHFPPTIGMVTLDAVDCNGELHKNASTAIFSADTLTSQLIRLDSVFSPIRKKLQLSDSIRFSFYYLPGGGQGHVWERIGDAPEADDSLFLEFYNSLLNKWEKVWSIGGICVDSLLVHTGKSWQYVSIPIVKTDYLSSNFQFRFRNYCSLDNNPKTGMVGNCDQWNIDYVKLGVGRTMNDFNVRDVAFVKKAPSLLKRYQSIPAKQFLPTDMEESINITITNLYSQPLTTSYSFGIFDEFGNELYNYDGGHENAPAYFPNQTYQSAESHANPSLDGFVYPVMNEPARFQVKHILKEGASGDARRNNDTLIYEQVIDNYYSYDDGIPENGYGITSTSSKIFLACRYDLNVPDTLCAVDLYFNKTFEDENQMLPFQLCIWDVNNNHPGQLIYKDPKKYFSKFEGSNQFVRYKLSAPIVVNGSIFVGLEQHTNDFINLGFDRNNDASQYIYYRTSSDWQQSILKGALMLRPYFGSKALLRIDDEISCARLNVVPNPAIDLITISCAYLLDESMSFIFDSKGKQVFAGKNCESIDVSSFHPGLYIIRVVNSKSGEHVSTKFIKLH